MGIKQELQKELEDSQLWLNREIDESTYKQDLRKRIELINWVIANINHPPLEICDLVESRMNELVSKINEADSIIESDMLHSELMILNWILYQVSKIGIVKS
jgi:uncharacterized protein YicC (UPF0701 family)